MKKLLGILVLVVGSILLSNGIQAQTSTWNGSSWSGIAPDADDGSTTFIVQSGTPPTYTIGMIGSLVLNSNTGFNVNNTSFFIISDSVRIETGAVFNANNLGANQLLTINQLKIFGTGAFNTSGKLKINNLIELGGSLTLGVNKATFSAGFSFLKIFNGKSYSISDFITGSNLSLQNLYVNENSTLVIDKTVSVGNTLTIDNSTVNFNNNLSCYNLITNNICSIGGNGSGVITINHSGSSNGYIDVQSGSLVVSNTTINPDKINVSAGATLTSGASITASGKADIYGNYNQNYDVSIAGVVTVDGTGVFKTNNASTTLGTLTLSNGGTFSSTSTSAHTLAVTTFTTLRGKLWLNPHTTLTYPGTTLDMNGSSSSVAYLNKQLLVAMLGTNDTVRNCTFRKLDVANTKSVVVNNASGYKIGNITTSGTVNITSLPNVDSLYIGSGGLITLATPVRVKYQTNIIAGGNLTSNGNLIMQDQSDLYFASTGQIAGNINVHRKYGSLGWIYMGAPFSGPARNTLSATSFGMNKYVESADANTSRWTSVGTNESLASGVGYALAFGTPPANDTLVFTGNPTLENVTVSGLTYTTTNNTLYDSNRGYNLVANPYTAPYSVSYFFTDNAVANNAVYFWDVADAGKSKGVYVCRTNTGIYTPDLSSVTTKNRSKISASYFSPHQAFFVKVSSNNQSISFDKTHITADKNTTFLKSGTANYLRLFVNNNTGSQNDIVVQFNDAATNGYDNGYDFYKLLSGSFPVEMYSLIGNEQFAIQTIKNVTDETRIPLGIVVQNNEKHVFQMKDFTALPAGVNVYLNDLTAKRFVNLKDSSFTVSLSAGIINNRFELVFKKGDFNGATGVDDVYVKMEIKSYIANGKIFVDMNGLRSDILVQITDMKGQVLYNSSYKNAEGILSLDYSLKPYAPYFIKVSGNTFSKVNKVVLQ